MLLMTVLVRRRKTGAQQERDARTTLKAAPAPLARFEKVRFYLPKRSPILFPSRVLGFVSRIGVGSGRSQSPKTRSEGEVSCKSS